MLTQLELETLSKRLLKIETSHPAQGHLAVSGVCKKLRRPLVTLAGASGFQALVSRAHSKARREAPWLHAIKVGPDGCLEVGSLPVDVESAEALAAQVTLVTHLLGLLSALIGAALTRSLVSGAWPEMSLEIDPGVIP